MLIFIEEYIIDNQSYYEIYFACITHDDFMVLSTFTALSFHDVSQKNSEHE